MKKNKIKRVLFTELVKDTTLVSIGEKFTLNGITSVCDSDTQFSTYPITKRDLVIAAHLKMRMEKHNLKVVVHLTEELSQFSVPKLEKELENLLG
jgi:hypothetical protein